MSEKDTTPVKNDTKAEPKATATNDKQTKRKYFLPETEQVVEASDADSAGKQAKKEKE